MLHVKLQLSSVCLFVCFFGKIRQLIHFQHQSQHTKVPRLAESSEKFIRSNRIGSFAITFITKVLSELSDTSILLAD